MYVVNSLLVPAENITVLVYFIIISIYGISLKGPFVQPFKSNLRCFCEFVRREFLSACVA